MRTKAAPTSLPDRIRSIGYGIAINRTSEDDADLIDEILTASREGYLDPRNFANDTTTRLGSALQRLRASMKTEAGRQAKISRAEMDNLFSILTIFQRRDKLRKKLMKLAISVSDPPYTGTEKLDSILGLRIPRDKLTGFPGLYHDYINYFMDWDLKTNRGVNPVGSRAP